MKAVDSTAFNYTDSPQQKLSGPSRVPVPLHFDALALHSI